MAGFQEEKDYQTKSCITKKAPTFIVRAFGKGQAFNYC